MEDKIIEMEERIKREETTGQQLFGWFLIEVGIINALELVAKAMIRVLAKGNTLLIGAYEQYVGMIRISLVVLMLALCLSKLKKMFFHSPDTKKLVIIWGVILVPIQLINDVCVMLYTRMLELVQAVLLNSGIPEGPQTFALIYDMTHGFKYICMLIALLLGIIFTGQILEKKSLIVLGMVSALLFMVAFTIFRMQTVAIDSIVKFTIGINWTSTIFHLLTTMGLVGVGYIIVKTFKKGGTK